MQLGVRSFIVSTRTCSEFPTMYFLGVGPGPCTVRSILSEGRGSDPVQGPLHHAWWDSVSPVHHGIRTPPPCKTSWDRVGPVHHGIGIPLSEGQTRTVITQIQQNIKKGKTLLFQTLSDNTILCNWCFFKYQKMVSV